MFGAPAHSRTNSSSEKERQAAAERAAADAAERLKAFEEQLRKIQEEGDRNRMISSTEHMDCS